MLNSGSHPATEAHFALESGVKFAYAGISGGKKNDSMIWIYLCSLVYTTAPQPLGILFTLEFCSTAYIDGSRIIMEAPKPKSTSTAKRRNSVSVSRKLSVLILMNQ